MQKKRSAILSFIITCMFISALQGIVGNTYALKNNFGIVSKDDVKITKVLPNSPASEANLQISDIVLFANNQSIKNTSTFTEIISKNINEPILLQVNRNGEMINVRITPRTDLNSKTARIGIEISDKKHDKRPVYLFLTTNIIALLTAIGLWRFKKWSVYTYLGLSIYYIGFWIHPFILGYPIVDSSKSQFTPEQAFKFALMIIFLCIAYEIISAIYIFNKRKLFN